MATANRSVQLPTGTDDPSWRGQRTPQLPDPRLLHIYPLGRHTSGGLIDVERHTREMGNRRTGRRAPAAVRDGDADQQDAAALWTAYGRMYAREHEPLVSVERRPALRPMQSGADQGAPGQQRRAELWSIGRMSARRVESDADVLTVQDRSSSELDGGAGAAAEAIPGPDTSGHVVEEPGDRIIRVTEFLRGYRDAGGPHEYESHIVNDVIPCEYGWEPYVKVNYYESRAQFDPQSWETAGGGDPADDYTVGRNVANWIGMIADPGSTSGWPYCWNRGGY